MMTAVLLPTINKEIIKKFYINIMGFDHDERHIYLPNTNRSVELRCQIITEETVIDHPYLETSQQRHPLFRYHIEKGFIPLIEKLEAKGVNVIIAADHPGGYYAHIEDPSRNSFEIMCDSFD